MVITLPAVSWAVGPNSGLLYLLLLDGRGGTQVEYWFCHSTGHLFHVYKWSYSISNNDPLYLGAEWLPMVVMSWQEVKEMYQW